MVIGTKLKKFYQKNNNIIKKITSTNSNGLIFKIYKEKKIDWFSHQPNKVQKQQQSNKPNTTSRLHNTELRLRLSFVFILYLCFKVRISFWCFIKFLKKFRGNLGKKNQTFWKKNPKCSPMWIFNRKGKERERVKREEEEESLEKCCIIVIFLQFLLSNMLWL